MHIKITYKTEKELYKKIYKFIYNNNHEKLLIYNKQITSKNYNKINNVI